MNSTGNTVNYWQKQWARLLKNAKRLFRKRNPAVMADLQQFRQEFAWASVRPDTTQDKRLLVVSLTEWTPQVKMESVLAKALEGKGYVPYIVTHKRSSFVHGYHRTFGICNFVQLRSFISGKDRRTAETVTSQILDSNPDFKDVVDLEYQGVQIGRHALSTVVHKLKRGTVAFDDPFVRQLLHKNLRQAIQYVHASEKLLDQVNPDQLLMHERGYVPVGEIFDVALNRDIPVIQYLHSHRRDALLFKRYTKETRNNHPWSLSDATWADVQASRWTEESEAGLMEEVEGRYKNGTWFNRKYLQVGKQLKSPDAVRQQLGLDPKKGTAVVFSHVLWDATFFYGESLFDDYEQWLVETVKVARQNDSVNWVIKLHPDYVWKMKLMKSTDRPPEYQALEAKVGPLPDHVKILAPDTDIATYSLFAITDWCITVRGTIGIEMSCFGIPVITAGTGRYAGLGFTIDSQSRERYLDRIRNLIQIPKLSAEQTRQARQHAHAVFRRRPIPMPTIELRQDDFDSVGHDLDHQVLIRVNSLAELAAAPDVKLFAEWAASDERPELLLPENNSIVGHGSQEWAA